MYLGDKGFFAAEEYRRRIDRFISVNEKCIYPGISYAIPKNNTLISGGNFPENMEKRCNEWKM